MSDEDLLKILTDFRKPDKISKLTLIPGWLKIGIQSCTEQPSSKYIDFLVFVHLKIFLYLISVRSYFHSLSNFSFYR